ncbi:winged helix-turn-helix transcriptional regulator [Methylophilus luteus]|uniref:Winged helix-turn-helix transcriptional regulator n=1 Tax=Methylophilus luteus TaxID=640108 RepID=A0ABW3FB92_9PROT
MKNKSLEKMHCPIARSLEHVGEWWNILILRDAMLGTSKFDDFQNNLGIATSTLTRRLNGMVESGLLVRHLYCEKPPRYEYKITQKGLDFRPVLLTIMQWGNKYYAEDGLKMVLVDVDSGAPVDLVLVDKTTHKEIDAVQHKTLSVVA